jgi:hypothetical protein
MAEQLDIFGAPPRDTDRTHNYRCTACGRKGHNERRCPDSIDARFAAFHQANPRVFDEMLRLARGKVAAGATRIGVKALWEELRVSLAKRELAYDSDFEQPPGGGPVFKLNNSHTSLYARKLIEHDPSLAAVIELRTRKAKK